jgi:hypothetical protein
MTRMGLSSCLLAKCLLFKGVLCLWGPIVPLLFASGHLWVVPWLFGPA